MHSKVRKTAEKKNIFPSPMSERRMCSWSHQNETYVIMISQDNIGLQEEDGLWGDACQQAFCDFPQSIMDYVQLIEH